MSQESIVHQNPPFIILYPTVLHNNIISFNIPLCSKPVCIFSNWFLNSFLSCEFFSPWIAWTCIFELFLWKWLENFIGVDIPCLVVFFLATPVALHFTPVSEWLSHSFGLQPSGVAWSLRACFVFGDSSYEISPQTHAPLYDPRLSILVFQDLRHPPYLGILKQTQTTLTMPFKTFAASSSQSICNRGKCQKIFFGGT